MSKFGSGCNPGSDLRNLCYTNSTTGAIDYALAANGALADAYFQPQGERVELIELTFPVCSKTFFFCFRSSWFVVS